MAAIANLGFAMQAADIGTRSVLGLHRKFSDGRNERSGRAREVLHTIAMYETAVENLSSGGADLVATSDQLLRSHIAKIVGTMKELKGLFARADLEMQACSDVIEAQVMDDTKWLRFRELRSELEMQEKGLQFLTWSRILRYGIHMGSIGGRDGSQSIAQICDRTGNPANPDSHPPDRNNPANLCHIIKAREPNDNTLPDSLSLLPSGFVHAKRHTEDGLRCITNRCLCSCHQKVVDSWGYLHFLRTTPGSLFTPCTRTSCKTRSLQVTAAVDLSWLNISYAIMTSFKVFWGVGRFSIQPSMDVKRVVAPNSRGFEISDKFRNGQYSAEDAAEAFRAAFREGQASLLDVTPDGRLLTTSLMRINCLGDVRQSCTDIAYLLKTVAGHSAVMECLPALFNFCKFALQFGGIDPFQILDDLGIIYDVAEEDVLCFHRVVDHIVDYIGDPFGIRWLQNCLRKCPGFANIPWLIQAILVEDSSRCTRTTTIPGPSVDETFLGRSALHWAACSEPWTRHLLEAGYDVAAADHQGRSPLMYAAANGSFPVCLALLEAGADVNSSYQQETRSEWNFLRFAVHQGHFHVVFGSIDFLRRESVRRFEAAQNLLDQALCLSNQYANPSGPCMLPHELNRTNRAAVVQKLLELGADSNVFQSCGENVLHLQSSDSHSDSETLPASLILDAGSKHLNVGGISGETPAMRAAFEADAPLLQLYILRGAGLQRRDNHGRNIVHYAIGKFHWDVYWPRPDDLWWRYSTLGITLSHGVCADVGDHCRCVCSLNGCSPSTMLMKQLFSEEIFYIRPAGLVLSIEWLLLLQELVSYNAAEMAYAECARFLLFQMLGLTHVCCQSNYRWSFWEESRIDPEDILEILDEEQEMIVMLEQDLETLRLPHDQRDPAEAWADMLVDYVKEHGDRTRSSCSGNISFRRRLLHYGAESSRLLRAVYQDHATYLVRLERRQAIVKRCLERLKAP